MHYHARVFVKHGVGSNGVMARSLWTGTISFGLVSVPVRMFSATESKELRCELVEKTQKKGSRSRKRASKAS